MSLSFKGKKNRFTKLGNGWEFPIFSQTLGILFPSFWEKFGIFFPKFGNGLGFYICETNTNFGKSLGIPKNFAMFVNLEFPNLRNQLGFHISLISKLKPKLWEKFGNSQQFPKVWDIGVPKLWELVGFSHQFCFETKSQTLRKVQEFPAISQSLGNWNSGDEIEK